MSRFFASVNHSDSDSSSEDEEVIEEPTRRRVVSFSSDDEQEIRLVKSVKNKIIDETNACAQSISNFKKINDYAGLLTRFEDLVKIHTKYQKEFRDRSVPGVYIYCLAELLTYVTAAWEDTNARKTLTKIGFKSLTSLRQKIRKFAKNFEVALAEYSENPDKFQDEEKTEVSKKPKCEIERERSPSPDWGSSSGDDSSSSDDDTPYSTLREKFLKKAGQKEGKEEKEGKAEKKERKKKEAKREVIDEGEWETVRGGSIDHSKPQFFSSDSDVTPKSVIDKLNEVAGKRGIKRTDRIKQLQDIYEIAVEKQCGPGVLAKARICQIGALLDYNMTKQNSMKPENWLTLLKHVEKISEMICAADFEVLGNSLDDEQLEGASYKLRLSLSALVERLCEEHKKILKYTDAYTAEYWGRLKDDEKIVSIIENFIVFLEKKNQTDELCRLKTSQIELMYYKLQKKPEDGEKALAKLEALCKYVYVQDGTHRLRTRAILAHIYHLAIHDHWQQAKDLMLMSHLQSLIENADIDTQILFNRAIAQLGLCAFRQGQVHDTHNCLMHLIRGVAKTRQLLGQGVSFRRDREGSREQEAKERQLQLPPHMYIPVEQIEASFMVSAMLVEVPLLMQVEGEARTRIISRSFKHLLRNSDRSQQVPPETLHQYIADAARALANFDWRLCRDLIFNPTMDAKVWNGIEQSTHVKDNIIRLIQKQTLKMYLKDLATQVYDSVSMAHLTELFGLDSEAETLSLLAGLINNGHLNASISLPHETLVFHPGSRHSEVHKRAHWMTEVCQQLLEQSERVFGMNDRFYHRKTSNRQGV